MALTRSLHSEIAAFLREHYSGYDLREAVRSVPHGEQLEADLPNVTAPEEEVRAAILSLLDEARLGAGYLEALAALHPTARTHDTLRQLASRVEADQLLPEAALLPPLDGPEVEDTSPKVARRASGRTHTTPVASAEAQPRSVAFTGDVQPPRPDDPGTLAMVDALAEALVNIQDTATRGSPAKDGIPTPALATLYLLVGPARPGHQTLAAALYAALRSRAPALAERAVFVLASGVAAEGLPAGATVDARTPDAVLRNPGLAGVLSMGGDLDDPQLRSWWGIGRTLPLRLPWLAFGAGGGFSRWIAEQSWHSVYGPTVTTFSVATLRAALHTPNPSAELLFDCLRSLLRHVSSFEPLRSDIDHFVADLAGRGGEQAVSDLTHLLELTDAAVSNHSKGAWVQRHAVTLVVAATAVLGITALAFVEQGRVSAAQEQLFVEKSARESAEAAREQARTEATRSLPPPTTLERFLTGSAAVSLGTPDLLRLWNDPALAATPAADGCDVTEWIIPGPIERVAVQGAGSPTPGTATAGGAPNPRNTGSAALVPGLAVEVHTRLTVRRYVGTSSGSCRAAPLVLTRAEAPSRAFCVELRDAANASSAANLPVPQSGNAAVEVASLSFHTATAAAWCAVLTPQADAVSTEALPAAHARATTPVLAPSRMGPPGAHLRWFVAVPPDGAHGDLHRMRLVTDRETPGASRLVLDAPDVPGIPLARPSDADRGTLTADLQLGLAALTNHCEDHPNCGAPGQAALAAVLAPWRSNQTGPDLPPVDRATWMEPSRMPDREDDAVWVVAVSLPATPKAPAP